MTFFLLTFRVVFLHGRIINLGVKLTADSFEAEPCCRVHTLLIDYPVKKTRTQGIHVGGCLFKRKL